MSSLRVLSFGSVPPEWGGARRGGVATFHRTLVEELRARADLGVEIVGIVSNRPAERPSPVPIRGRSRGETPEAFVAALQAEFQADVAILHELKGQWAEALPRMAPGLPRIGIAHSWHSITQGPEPEEARERVQTALNRLAVLVVPTKHALREGRGLGLRLPANTRVIRYPLPHAFAQPVVLDQPRSGVVFAGELIARKNAIALLEATSLSSNLALTIVGAGPEQHELERAANAIGLKPRVRFVGSVGPNDLRSILSRAEVFCLPSLSESFGIVYIEALACGTPVVGFGPAIDEIALTCALRIGVGLRQSGAEAVVAAIKQVRGEQWDRAALRRAAVEQFAPGDVAAEYARVLIGVGPPESGRLSGAPEPGPGDHEDRWP